MIFYDAEKNRIKINDTLISIDPKNCGETGVVVMQDGELVLPDIAGVACNIPLRKLSDETGVLKDFVVSKTNKEHVSKKQACLRWADVNLADAGSTYYAEACRLNNMQTAKLNAYCGEIMEPGNPDDFVMTDILTLADAGIGTYDCDYCGSHHETERSIIRRFLKESRNGYLVYAYGCRWNGASGYKICDKIEETIYRDHDATLRPRECTDQGNILVCIESSQDVPTGATTVIVALNNKDRTRLEDATFDKVKVFADECLAKISA